MYLFKCHSEGEARLLLKTLHRKGVKWVAGESILDKFLVRGGYTIRKREDGGLSLSCWNGNYPHWLRGRGFRPVGWSEILKL